MISCKKRPKADAEQGNVLFVILIAVALFGYLGFAMTQSSRSTASNTSQTAFLDASEIIKHAAHLSSTVERTNLVNHCRLSQMSFDHQFRVNYNASGGGFYYNANAPEDGSCHIFDMAGGGANYAIPPESSQRLGGDEYNVQANFGVYNIGSDGGDAGVDLTLTTFVPYEVCFQINKIMGNENPLGDPPVANVATISIPGTAAETFPNFTDFPTSGIGLGSTLGGTAGNATELAGRPTGCFYASAADQYIFYSVIMPR